MITEGHYIGLEESHNKRKCAKVKSIEKMSQEEFDREMNAIKGKISYMVKLLQEEKMQENQRHGWNMKNKFQWLVMKLYEDKLWKILQELKQRINDLM